MNRASVSLFGLALLVFVGPASAASPPGLVQYQGVLRDAAGKPETGSRDMVFRLFSAALGGQEYLVDRHVAGNGGPVTVTNGLFEVLLGSGAVSDGSGVGTYTDISSVLRDLSTVWMQVEVGGEVLSPRVRVFSTPFSLNADRIGGKDGAELLDTSSTGQTKAGNLTIGGQLLAAAPSGTAPLVVGSNTVVPNLNVEMIEWPWMTGSDLLNTTATPQTKQSSLTLFGDLLLAGRINTNFGSSPDLTTEIYPMDQPLRTIDVVRFHYVFPACVGSETCSWAPDSHQNVDTGSSPTFGSLYLYQSVPGLRTVEDIPANVGADDATMTFCVDCNNNEGGQYFYWKINTPAASPPTGTDYLMSLTGAGNLYLRGNVAPNHVFDLAELYRQAVPVEPGDLVRVVPGEPSAVAPTAGANDRALIGVVSTRPGFLLGGVMDAESLRTGWGQKAFDTYQAMLPELRQAALAAEPSLRDAEARLASAESFRAWSEAERSRLPRAGPIPPPRPPDGKEPASEAVEEEPITKPDDSELARQFESARASQAQRMESLTLERFMAAKYAPIALAGRVPVKVDASFGAIEIGDSLTSSPIPGVAMKATAGGPTLGKALEARSSGMGKIEVLVGRRGGSLPVVNAVPAGVSAAVPTAPFPEGSTSGGSTIPGGPAHRVAASTVETSTADRWGNAFPETGTAAMLEVSPAVRVGEVLVLGSNGAAPLQASFTPNDSRVVGVALGDAVEGRAPVAGPGFAVVRAEASSKPIARGDPLVTSALTGHAMKAPSPPEPGTVIGKALESLDFGTGRIRVLLMAR